jgi:hypothetical protein
MPSVADIGFSELGRDQFEREAYFEARRRKGLRGFPASRWDWVNVHRANLWPDVRLDWEEHKYLVGIYKDEHDELVVQKAGQMGLSELMISDAFWAADVCAANVLYLLPRTGDVMDFSTTRVGLAIEASPYIQSIIEQPDYVKGAQRARDRLTLKRIRNRFFYMRHAAVKTDGRAPQLKVAAIDMVIHDEIDEMDHRAFPLADKRLGHSALKWKRWISTPSIPDYGIHAKYLESDQRVWLLKCDACNKEQELDPFQNLILNVDGAGRPTQWFHKKRDVDAVFVGCKFCGKPMNRLGEGRWIATEESDVHGYKVNKLMMGRVNLLDLIRKGQTFNETERKEWWNQDLGLPYAPRGGGFDKTLIRSTVREYDMPATAQRCAMGVDVGAVLHVVIRRFTGDPRGNGNRVRKAVFIDEVADFEDLDGLMRRYDVRSCVVDALPETRSASAFARRFPGKVKIAYYAGAKVGMKRDEPTLEKTTEEFVVDLDRTRWFDMVKAFMMGREIVNPPRILDESVLSYAKHFRALTRIVEESGGVQVARWVRSRDDHFAHAELYCGAAMDLMGTVTETDIATMVSPDDDGREEDWMEKRRESSWNK